MISSNWRSEGVYFVIFNATNVLNYVYLVFVGFFLGPDSYGLFGALFGIVYLSAALGNMVKMAVARHVATVQASNSGAIRRQVVTAAVVWTGGFAALIGVVLLVATPLIAGALDSPTTPVLWSCLAITLSVWVPATHGILQGLERFPALGSALLVAAVVRIGMGGALVVGGAGVSGAMAGVAAGFAVSAVFSLWLCLMHVKAIDHSRPWVGVSPPRIGALASVLVASIVVAAPTSLDVAVVRYAFSGEEAGIYTGIAVLGRVIIFASVAVPFTILPKVAARTASGLPTGHLLAEGMAITGSLAVSAALGIVFVTSVLGIQVGGIDVASASAALHWYLAAMVLFSLAVTIIYYQVGRGSSTFILAAGLPCVLLQAVLVGLVPGSLTAVAQLMFVLNAALLTVGLAFALLGARKPLTTTAPAYLRRDATPAGAGRWPNFFIVGAPRAGTTSLYHYLREHPDIFMPQIKEPHFFSGVQPGSERLHYVRSRAMSDEEEYLGLFGPAQSEKAVGEASPSYLEQVDAPGRIKAKAPDAKIIIVLREPVERAYSQYLADYREGAQTLSFADALAEDRANPVKAWGPAHLYVELGMYNEQVQRYLDTFGPEQVRIYLYDDLSRDPRAIVEDICGFLGVDYGDGSFFDSEERYNTYAAPRGRLVQRLMGVAVLRNAALRIVPVGLLTKLRDALFLSRRAKPVMDEESRLLLRDIYQRDIEALQGTIGRNLSSWLEGDWKRQTQSVDAVAMAVPCNAAAVDTSIVTSKSE